MKRFLIVLVALMATPLLIAAASTQQQPDQAIDHPHDPQPPGLPCDCNSLITTESDCECLPVALIVLHKKRAKCTPYNLQTGAGCDQQDDKCERRVGVTFGAPCDQSVVVAADTPCRSNNSAEVPCPMGPGRVKLTVYCLNCSVM